MATRFAEAPFDAHGAVHVLCNNAGVVKRARSWEFTLDDWRWVLDVDLWGVIHGVRSFVPRMLAQGEGHVVNTSSMAALLPIPNLRAYPVRVNAIAPGKHVTPMNAAQIVGDPDDIAGAMEAFKTRTPLRGRVGVADDIAHAACDWPAMKRGVRERSHARD